MSRVLYLDEITKNKDLSGKVYIVTGANSGVGFETSKQLVKQGAHVVMACRRPQVGKDVAKVFDSFKGSYDVMKLDLADLSSVRTFAKDFLGKYDRLDGLDCNAGLVTMGKKPVYTKDGLEMSIGVSFFGHFLLTELLLDVLKKSAPSRIIILSSCVHAGSDKLRYDVHLDDLNFKKREFNNFAAYSEAKVANALYALELADRLKGTGVTTASVHPGWARSNFGKGPNKVSNFMMSLMKPFTYFISDSSEQAAQTSLHCLISDDAPKHSGEYFSQWSVLYSDKECRKGGWPMKSPNRNARDLNKAKKLVNKAYEIVGLEKTNNK